MDNYPCIFTDLSLKIETLISHPARGLRELWFGLDAVDTYAHEVRAGNACKDGLDPNCLDALMWTNGNALNDLGDIDLTASGLDNATEVVQVVTTLVDPGIAARDSVKIPVLIEPNDGGSKRYVCQSRCVLPPCVKHPSVENATIELEKEWYYLDQGVT